MIETPIREEAKPKKGPSAAKTSLAVFLVLLVLTGSGILVYVTVYHPGELHAQATAVAGTFLTAQAQASAGLSTPQAMATANASQEMYTQATNGSPFYSNSLQGNTGGVWITGEGCDFTGGAYHVVGQKGLYITCPATLGPLGNLAFEAQVTIVKESIGGLMFRASQSTSGSLQGYFFGIDIGGGYYFTVYQNGQGVSLTHGFSQAVRTGRNSPNVLSVLAHGSNMYLYINHQYVDSVSNATFTSGLVGVFCLSFYEDGDVAFNNVRVWSV
jgi:hypothetical protein